MNMIIIYCNYFYKEQSNDIEQNHMKSPIKPRKGHVSTRGSIETRMKYNEHVDIFHRLYSHCCNKITMISYISKQLWKMRFICKRKN